MHRRTFLRRATALPATLAVAGCAAPGTESGGSDGSTDGAGNADGAGIAPIPRIENPPEAVYLPGHRKSMRVLEPVAAGDYALAPMLTYPHPFWTVTGTDRHRVDPTAGRGVHLMLVCWDRETGIVLPGDAEPRVTITRRGERVASRQLWPMLSQEMGVHFGDNVTLPADDTYTVSVSLPPLPTRRTGSLADRFTEGGTATFEFTYDRAFREDVVEGIDLLERERWGDRGALEPMTGGDGSANTALPYSALPPAADVPGTRLVDPDAAASSLPSSGDATFVVTLLEPDSRLADGERGYLLVSPRTPYNRVPLVNTSLRAAVRRNGAGVGDEALELTATLDAEVGLHYGRSVADVRPGDSITLTVASPPQAARHQGYETAFFDMEPLELAVPPA
ncbi:DUF7350 domain-containing protein [Natrinema pallidum]|uniref:DUF7350 domain-containing protein n=2 Tax=Natrinema pallidum TaxID=69527 RepID=L9YXI2_9EURY|nr:hypothetical protein [Natrinema pallidum]ELY78834.1 hypothetical protein C487_07732 [Natrinema pallidum DSM 3751]QCW03635.1 hypothetical protein FGF80_10465 [Natrinema pallidum]